MHNADLISRQAAIDRINKQREHLEPDVYPQDKIGDAAYRICAEFIERLPSAQPYTEEEIQAMQDLEQAQLDKAYQIGVEEGRSAQPESRREWYMKGYRDAQDAAMHESCTDCPLYDHDRHNCPRFNKVIPRAIEEVKPRWIPVTPDSPPCYMPVLTWDGETRHVEQRIPYVRDESGEKIISDWWIDGDEKWDEWAEYQPNIRDGCAIKWMPLPEPYKEEQE